MAAFKVKGNSQLAHLHFLWSRMICYWMILPRHRVRGASLGSMRRWLFHGRGGKRRPAPFCGEAALNFWKGFSRPMLPALIAPNPVPRIGIL